MLSELPNDIYPEFHPFIYKSQAINLVLPHDFTLVKVRVDTADSKLESSTSKYFWSASNVLCPEIFWITFNGTPDMCIKVHAGTAKTVCTWLTIRIVTWPLSVPWRKLVSLQRSQQYGMASGSWWTLSSCEINRVYLENLSFFVIRVKLKTQSTTE